MSSYSHSFDAIKQNHARTHSDKLNTFQKQFTANVLQCVYYVFNFEFSNGLHFPCSRSPPPPLSIGMWNKCFCFCFSFSFCYNKNNNNHGKTSLNILRTFVYFESFLMEYRKQSFLSLNSIQIKILITFQLLQQQQQQKIRESNGYTPYTLVYACGGHIECIVSILYKFA